MNLLQTLTLVSAMLALAVGPAKADCAQKDALGTTRTLAVDPAAYPRVGLKSFPQTLPLADKEVVLTFDDGPFPPTTRRLLAALGRECVKATFFMIGKSAAANPELVRLMAAQGHTIAHHSLSHANLADIKPEAAIEEIDRGFAADEMALHGRSSETPSTPFFRFPYFSSTPALLDQLQLRGIAVFGADFWASDWEPMTPQQQLALITERLEKAGRGIILFHDTKAQTAAMMPDFLRYLHDHHYRVVHIVPPTLDKHAGHAP